MLRRASTWGELSRSDPPAADAEARVLAPATGRAAGVCLTARRPARARALHALDGVARVLQQVADARAGARRRPAGRGAVPPPRFMGLSWGNFISQKRSTCFLTPSSTDTSPILRNASTAFDKASPR